MSQESFSGMEKAPQRASLKALGLTDAEVKKPLIAVVCAHSGFTAYGNRLVELSDAVKAGVYVGGGTPVTVTVPDICGTLSGTGAKYALPARELVADSVETLLVSQAFDGAVFVVGGDMAAAGALMGAARVNIPSVFVTAGATTGGTVSNEKVGISDVFEGVGAVSGGTIDMDKLTTLENRAGCDNGMSTANALGIVCEALGMALSGNGSIPSAWSERVRLAKKSGLKVCGLVRDAVTPRMIMTARAIGNAVTVCSAVNAPADTVLHISALAAECGVRFDLETVQKISDATPTLCALRPYGKKDMEDFCNAGGVAAVLRELGKMNLIDGGVQTVSGETLAFDYAHAHVTDTDTIAKSDCPLSDKGCFALLKGNLAEDGAIVNRYGIDKSARIFNGKAKCFNCEEDAVAAIFSGNVKKGDMLVIRYEGPVGGPGMRSLSASASALVGMGLGNDVVIITDGRASDMTSGYCIGNVCPEAALGGRIAIVKDGDNIKVNVNEGKIVLDVPAKELNTRQKKLKPRDANASGWLLRYQNLVTAANVGAVFKKKF